MNKTNNTLTTLNSKWMSGTVHWFDKHSGEGVVKDAEGNSYFVHYSAINSDSKWKTLSDKASVRFKLIQDTTFVQVSQVEEVRK